VRLTLTALGHTWLDLRIFEAPDATDDESTREGWPVDTSSTLTETRIGYIDDVGVGSTFPWE